MKGIITTAFSLFAAAGLAQAELKIPGSVFKMDELAEAKAKAAKMEKPLVFVYTDPGTS